MRPFLKPGTVNIILDGQFGSTGKGVIAGYLAKHEALPINLAVTNAAPNAGHTVDFNDGRGKMITHHLPTSALWDEKTSIYLCAGSIINPAVLNKELQDFRVNPSRVLVHPHAAIITDEDIESEKNLESSVSKIASTQKGVGAALARKIQRQGNVAMNHKDAFMPGITIGSYNINEHLLRHPQAAVVMEVPQGFGLSVNSGFYPYTTCREVSVSQALADAAVHPSFLGSVMMSIRTFPIRVGNIVDDEGKERGYSGPFYPDSQELTWEDMKIEPERTTVTKRIRRVATFSQEQYKESISVLRPSHVFLNFCNYLPDVATLELLLRECAKTKPITHIGVGPTTADVRNVGHCVLPEEAAGIAFNK